MRNGERGFTYLLLLFVLALAAAGLGALGEQWQAAAQRERETELLFRGTEIAAALAHWRDSTPAGQPTAPLALDELLQDQRHSPPRSHLRRVYADPFTGLADWHLQRDAQGRIRGLASRSRAPAMRRVNVALRAAADQENPAVGDWLFTPPATPAVVPRKPPDERRR